MITARFFATRGELIGFEVSGHAMAGEFGSDVVCAAVTAVVEYTECLINDVLGAQADVVVDRSGASVSLRLTKPDAAAVSAIRALILYLNSLRTGHKENIMVEVVSHA